MSAIRNRKPWIIALGFIVFFLGACSPATPAAPTLTLSATETRAPTDTPLPTASPTRTQVPTRTPTPTATPPSPNPAYPLLTARVQAIQLMDDNGNRATRITPAQVKQWIDNANETWALASIRFLYDPAADFTSVKNTVVNGMGNEDTPEEREKWRAADEIAARYPGKVVIFFRYGTGSGAAGFSGWTINFLSVTGSVAPACGHPILDLLSHEIGHYFGLSHTHLDPFKSIAEAEAYLKAHGNNPNVFDNDKLADTPPDPYIGIPEIQCQPVTSITLNGIVFPVLRSNLMAYYDDPHPDLTPMQIERARWFFGVRAQNRMAMPVNTNIAEAIEFTVARMKASAGVSAREQDMEKTEQRWKNGTQLLLSKAQQNSSITFAMTADQPGRYALNLYATYGQDYGQIQTFVDGNPLGAPIDLYGLATVPTGKISVGEIDLSAGAHDLEFRVVGKNARSSGYNFGLDAFALVSPHL